jgi:hypothetical protein
MLRIALALFVLGLIGCTNAKKSRAVLEADGVTQIEMTGYSVFGCSENDTFADGFRGVKGGRRVKGVVCSGWMKGSTVRYTKVE